MAIVERKCARFFEFAGAHMMALDEFHMGSLILGTRSEGKIRDARLAIVDRWRHAGPEDSRGRDSAG